MNLSRVLMGGTDSKKLLDRSTASLLGARILKSWTVLHIPQKKLLIRCLLTWAERGARV